MRWQLPKSASTMLQADAAGQQKPSARVVEACGRCSSGGTLGPTREQQCQQVQRARRQHDRKPLLLPVPAAGPWARGEGEDWRLWRANQGAWLMLNGGFGPCACQRSCWRRLAAAGACGHAVQPVYPRKELIQVGYCLPLPLLAAQQRLQASGGTVAHSAVLAPRLATVLRHAARRATKHSSRRLQACQHQVLGHLSRRLQAGGRQAGRQAGGGSAGSQPRQRLVVRIHEDHAAAARQDQAGDAPSCGLGG